jgi:hypothetical protein
MAPRNISQHVRAIELYLIILLWSGPIVSNAVLVVLVLFTTSCFRRMHAQFN